MKRIEIDLEVHGAIERHRRAFSESENDILRRVLPFVAVVPPVPAASVSTAVAGSRRRGQWTVEIQGERIAAPNLKAAYAAAPHLARRHAEPLAGGWHYDSNVSAAQVARRARIAARLCGLRYGRDLRILDNLREL